MKQLLLIAPIFIMLTNFASAQSFHVGFKGGADIHKIDGAKYADQFRAGYHIGAFAEIGLNKKFAIQPEAYFSHVSSKISTTGSGISGIDKIKLEYINVPVLLNIKLVKLLSFQIGPQFGIAVNKNKSAFGAGSIFKTGEVGAAGGLQLNLKKFKVYARYIAGINDVNNVNSGKWHNQSIHAGVGFRII